MSILALAAVIFTNPWARLLLAIVALCKVISYMEGSELELRYSENNELFKEFIAKSKIAKLRFEPYLFGLTPLMQGVFYMVMEITYKLMHKNDFDRELLTLPDGGTIGIDWDGGIPDPSVTPDKPYLIICPGLNGDSRNLYTMALVEEARQKYKIGTLLFRGAQGVPITTPKLSYFGMWEDIEFGLNYVDQKYVRDPKTKEKRTRMYSYGCSLGG